jgi:hypothetical protein
VFGVRAAPRFWPRGLRAAVCTGTPGLAGWLLGELTAGLVPRSACSPASTAAGDHTSTIRLLAVIALSLRAAVGLGMGAAAIT